MLCSAWLCAPTSLPATWDSVNLDAVWTGGTVREENSSSAPAAMAPRFKLLVSNDDGIKAPGIVALVRELQATNLFDITVVAPAGERSAQAGALSDGVNCAQPSSAQHAQHHGNRSIAC